MRFNCVRAGRLFLDRVVFGARFVCFEYTELRVINVIVLKPEFILFIEL